MSQGRGKCGAVVNTVMNTLVPPNAGNLFTNSSTISSDWCTSVSLCEPAVKWGSVKHFPKMLIGLSYSEPGPMKGLGLILMYVMWVWAVSPKGCSQLRDRRTNSEKT
jgi:hypothetical protein